MKAFRSGIFLMMLMCLTGTAQAYARPGAPIVSLDNNPIFTKQATEPTLETIEQAITAAGASKSYPWVVTGRAPGKLLLSTVVRSKHTVVVEVAFDTKSYSIHYVSSVNMNYEKGWEYIHPKYNVWVQELKLAIDAELLKD